MKTKDYEEDGSFSQEKFSRPSVEVGKQNRQTWLYAHIVVPGQGATLDLCDS
jgi:hypothetical protein